MPEETLIPTEQNPVNSIVEKIQKLDLEPQHTTFLCQPELVAHMERYSPEGIHASSIQEAVSTGEIDLTQAESLFGEISRHCFDAGQAIPEYLNSPKKLSSFLATVKIVSDLGKTGPEAAPNIVDAIYLRLNSYTQEELANSTLEEILANRRPDIPMLTDTEKETLQIVGVTPNTNLKEALTKMHLNSLQKIFSKLPPQSEEVQLIQKIALNHHYGQSYVPPGAEFTFAESLSAAIQSLRANVEISDKMDATIKRSTKEHQPLPREKAIQRFQESLFDRIIPNIKSHERQFYFRWASFFLTKNQTFFPPNH